MVKKWLRKYFRTPKFLSKIIYKISSKLTPDLKTKRQKRPFIIPSRFGFYFGSGILVLIALAYTYANQLIYLIAFFYSSLVFIVMHLTNNNMKSVEVSEFFIRNFFQDEPGKIRITLQNTHSKYSARFISIELPVHKIKTVIDEIPPNAYRTVEIDLTLSARGRYAYPKLVLSSRFPFNLFYTWKRLSWNEQFFLYPAREGSAQPPCTSEDEISKKIDLSSAIRAANTDNFLGHRSYNQYDNYKRIDWRVYARKNKLYVKTFETDSARICFVDTTEYLRPWDDFDKRIKQLTKWIFEAQKYNTLFVVKLKNNEILFLDDRKKFESLFEKLSIFSSQDFS